MTQATKRLIDQFEALSAEERSELLVELARLVAFSSHDLPSEPDLIAAADQVFLEFDRREQAE